MKLFRIFQTANSDYDTYDSAIVCAKNEKEAKSINPAGGETLTQADAFSGWCGLNDVQAEYIGTAKRGIKKGVIVASFNAG